MQKVVKKGFENVGFVNAEVWAMVEGSVKTRILLWLGRELQIAKNTKRDCMLRGKADSVTWWEGYIKALEDVRDMLEEGAI